MTEIQQTENDTQITDVEETITIVVYEETLATYTVPVSLLRDLGLPTTSEELSDTTELKMQDIDEDTLMGIVEDIDLSDYAVQERRISFPTDA